MPKTAAFKSFLVTAAALASAVGLAGPASAATTWTVSGLPATFTSTNAVLTDTVTGTRLSCTSLSSVTATGTNGTGLSGTAIMRITAASWSGCSGPLGITFNTTAQNLPWNINAVSYNTTTGVVTGTVTNVEAHLSGVGCTADVRGATSTTPGTIDFAYTNSTHKITLLGTGNPHAYNVSGSCLGLINNGDALSYTGDYTTGSAVTLTSP